MGSGGEKFSGVRMNTGRWRRKRLMPEEEVLGRQNSLKCLLFSLDKKGDQALEVYPGIRERNMY